MKTKKKSKRAKRSLPRSSQLQQPRVPRKPSPRLYQLQPTNNEKMEGSIPCDEGRPQGVSASLPPRQPSSEDKGTPSNRKTAELRLQGPEGKSPPPTRSPSTYQRPSPALKQVRTVKDKTGMEAQTSPAKKMSPIASNVPKPGAASPELKATGARPKVPRIKAYSPRPKKTRVIMSPNQSPGTSSPSMENRQAVEAAAGNDQDTAVAVGTSQTAGLSASPSQELVARAKRPEGMPETLKDVEQAESAAASPLSSPGTPATLASPAFTLPDSQKEPVIVALLSAAVLVSTLVAFVLIWLSSPKPSFVRLANKTDTSFCCPNEAAELFSVIDDSVSPCRDLFAYVCKRAIENGAIDVGVTVDTLDEIAANVIKGTGNTSSPASRALHEYFTSCLSEVWQKDLRQKQITSFIVGVANLTSGRMTPADLLRFSLNIQFRYQLNFFFGILFGEASVEFEWNFLRAITFQYYCGYDCFDKALAGVNGKLRTNYSEQDIHDWQQLLPRAGDVGKPGDITTEELVDAFGGMDAALFETIVKEFYPDFSVKYRVFTSAKQPLLEEIRTLWKVSNQPMSLLYMLTSVAVGAMKEIQGRTLVNAPTAQIWQICVTHASRFAELWRMTYVDSLTSAAKDSRMRSIFVATRDALMRYEPLRGLMEVGNDTAKFEAFVLNTSLLLPRDLLLTDVTVPVLQPRGFADNYFRALGFDFDVKREVWKRGAQLQRDSIEYELWNRMGIVGEGLYVSPIAYGYLSAVDASRALLPDAPVVATRMAATLWRRVVEHDGWSSRTLAAIKYHRECMLKTFRAPDEIARELLETSMALQISASLAAGASAVSTDGSLVGAADDWFTPKLVWSLHIDTKARFFYSRYAYYACAEEEYSWNFINEPVRHSADFTAAFKCPPFLETTGSSACWKYMQ